jgi:DNA-binding NarL/FixJ family response regulator
LLGRALSVLVVEDSCMLRQLMRAAVEADPRNRVVGEAGDASAAAALIEQHHPDVVLLAELRIGGADALDLIAEVRRSGRKPAFIVIVKDCDHVTGVRVEKAMIHGFIDGRAEMCDAIRHALREIAQNRRYISPTLQRLRDSRVADPFSFDKLLTKRQLEVLVCVAQLQPDRMILKRLNISHATLRRHRRNIASKFNIPVKELPRYAREKGFANAP